MKKCMMCGKKKSLDKFNDFIKSASNPDGKRTVCKQCQEKRDGRHNKCSGQL